MIRNRFWGYLGRFALSHVIAYTVIALVFVNLQNLLPASGRVALDFFAPYGLGLRETCTQLLRGGVMGLVLYPFYDLIVKGNRGRLLLLAALWGLVLLGSLEPMPGSIEGMIYTETSAAEHLLVLAAGAGQVLLFARFFLGWEKSAGGGKATVSVDVRPRPRGYGGRFILLHVLLYWIVGMLFYQLTGYEEALDTMEVFALYRPLEGFLMVAVVFFGQIIRGGILALLVCPFYGIYMERRHGWVLLFGLLFGLMVLSTVLEVPAAWGEFVQGLKIGIPEITVQTFLFSWLFYKWERRHIT